MRLFALLAAFLFASAHAANPTSAQVATKYAQIVYTDYADAVKGAEVLQKTIEAFLASPSESGFTEARKAWTEARHPYSKSEVYRFYGGPIDADNGPEARINGWPLDEVYIDNIIARANQYPKLDKALLAELNEKDGEKNLSTGYHAIEFLLWGQDLYADSPGRRPYTDYVVGKGEHAERRGQYLKLVTELLIDDLKSVRDQWVPQKGAYVKEFLKAGAQKTALKNILTGLITMTGAELSQERMFVALDLGQQEDEHSCFSDTTHLDILNNYRGVKSVVMETGLLDLVRGKDAALADELIEVLGLTETAVKAIPAPFDQAILHSKNKVAKAIEMLEALTESLRQVETIL